MTEECSRRCAYCEQGYRREYNGREYGHWTGGEDLVSMQEPVWSKCENPSVKIPETRNA